MLSVINQSRISLGRISSVISRNITDLGRLLDTTKIERISNITDLRKISSAMDKGRISGIKNLG